MEASRKRPALSVSGSGGGGGPVGSKIGSSESPRKRLRPRSSVFLSRGGVKDLRSHRVFSPSSELSWDVLNQKLGLDRIDPGLANEDLGFDNGVAVSQRNELIRPCGRGKVYKTPGSFSYKRLLPYLINMSESNLGEIDQCSKLQATPPSSEQDSKKLRVSVECQSKSGLDCTDESQLTSPKIVALSPLNDRNEHGIKSDYCISSLDLISKDSESHGPISSMESSLIVKDDGVLDHHDGNKIKGKDGDFVKRSEVDLIEPVVVAEEKNQKGGDGDYDIDEQPKQMTPPDPEIYVRPDVEGSEADRPDHVLLDRANLNGSLSSGTNHEFASLVYSTSHDTNYKYRGVAKPRSQMKLFKCPGSFSYRRMLPFLMDIANDKSDPPVSGQLQKPDKDFVQPPLLVPADQETHSDKSSESFEENQKNAPSASVDAETGEPSSNEEVVSDTHNVLETSRNSLALVESEHNKSQSVSCLSSSNSESKSEPERGMTESERPSHFPRIPCGGPKRGILKRNPRGCRGLCSCLNCASFRLNAERAFEFSRNQMEDTEELVLELVNELSDLRRVLEKTADFACHVNQVKEACKKASEAEEVAKNRISQMNYDLGVHCRVTCAERPRIKFSNRVEEHLIPKPDAEEPNQEQCNV